MSTLNKFKNPDFIIPGPDVLHPFRGVTKVIEVFGDYWHSSKFTGLSNIEHENQIIQAYKVVNIDCLIIWEHEIKHDFVSVIRHVLNFIA